MSKACHFIGIKGFGMSVLVLMLHRVEHKVQESDVNKYCPTQRGLERAGIKISPFSEDNIMPNAELTAGNAFRGDSSVKIAYTVNDGFGLKRCHKFLGDFVHRLANFGVAGAHGKTSTTGLLSRVLENTIGTFYLIGNDIGHGLANSNYFVFKSDEYQRHFMPYHPEYSTTTNIDFDHPDYFRGTDDVLDTFNDYAGQVQKTLFLYGDDAYLCRVTSDADIYYYEFKDTDDFVAYDTVRTTNGSAFKVKYGDEKPSSFHLPAFGRHNILNATTVVASLYIAGTDMELIAEHMRTFTEAKRCFTERIINSAAIIDGFACHPVEVITTLDAACRKCPNKEITVTFQPHTSTHTVAPLDKLVDALNQVDSVYPTPIYGSIREISHGDVRVEGLANKIQESAEVIGFENVSPLLNHGDVIYVSMGAGDI